jgi:hypothetical protein
MLLVTIKKCLDTGFTAKISVMGQKRDEFLVVHFYAAIGINLKKGLINLLLVDALEVEAQLPCISLLHNLTFLVIKFMQGRSCVGKDMETKGNSQRIY